MRRRTGAADHGEDFQAVAGEAEDSAVADDLAASAAEVRAVAAQEAAGRF